MFYFVQWQFSVFPVLFQIATFEIQRLKYQLVEVVKEEEGGMEGGGGGGGWLEGG